MSFPKKCSALLLAFFLMFSHIGLALNVHFCGDEKVASSLVYSAMTDELCSHEKHDHHPKEDCSEQQSCCGASEDHSDCCKDEVITQDNAEVVVFKAFSFHLDAFILPENDYTLEFTDYSENIKQEHFEYDYNSNAPPLYELFCSLIYYA